MFRIENHPVCICTVKEENYKNHMKTLFLRNKHYYYKRFDYEDPLFKHVDAT